MSAPYYSDEHVTLYHGKHEGILPTLGQTFDLIVADPPYGETSLDWDRWPDGWPARLTDYSSSMWCFGSLRMFLDRRDDFAEWKLSQDLIWEKHNGSGFHSDRFKRVHEQVTHWYRGAWSEVHHETPTTADAVRRVVRTKTRPPQMGHIEKAPFVSEDGGPRLVRSVLRVRSMHGKAINETEKPTGLLEPMIEYACPRGGIVLDPFGGSCSTAVAARAIGRRAVCIESRESQCEVAAKRLAQGVLNFEQPA